MPPTVVIFEDQAVEALRPANLARATHRVTCGAFSLFDLIQEWGWPVREVARPHIARWLNPEGRAGGMQIPGPILFVNSALAPNFATLARVKELADAGEAFVALDDQRITAAYSPDGYTTDPTQWQNLPSSILDRRLPMIDDVFPSFAQPFDVVKHHEAVLPSHLERLLDRGQFRSIDRDVYVGVDAEIAPNVVFDAGEGPILIGNKVKIRPFAYLSGPLKIGDNCLIIDHAAIKHGTVLGHTVKAGGEIEVSIVEPFSNKQHHGFLGHAYVGSWVNLGAGTSNSDLKNTYGEIGIDIDGKSVATGMQFAGCVIGDHTKTAINTSIFTGKLIGVASFVYGFVTTNVPSFTNYARSFGQVTEVSAEIAAKTQRRMAARRKVEMSPADERLMQDMFDLTRGERQISGEQLSL
jgi:glucose-1-phosphate thymidylyltransferase